MKTTREQKIRIGLFAAVGLGLAALVLIVFGGLRFWQDKKTYYVEFSDSVYGLQHGAEVYYQGIRVGSVKKIKISPDDPRKVLVRMDVDGDAPVRTDTKVMLRFAGLTGLKVIDLQGGTPTAAVAEDGDRLAVGQSLLDKLEQQAQQMVDDTKEIMDHAKAMMTRADQVVENLAVISDPKRIEGIVEQTRLTAGNLAKASSTLNAMIAENRVALRSSIMSVDEAAKSTAELLDGQVAGVVENVGDMVSQLKQIIHDDGTQLRAALTDMKQASRTFKELARDVKARPSRLLFSSPQADRKLP